MATQAQQVLQGSTQELVHYPPVHRHPSSATVNVISPALGDLDDYQAATIDSADESTTVAASEGDLSLTFGSEPGATAGRLYCIRDEVDHFEAEVEVVRNGLTTYLKDPLPRDFAVGSRFRGLAITHALTAEETANTGTGLAVFKYVVAGVEYRDDVHFEVVRSLTRYTLTGQALLRKHPHAHQLRINDDDLDVAVDVAWTDIIVPSLLERKIQPENVVSSNLLEPAHTAAAMYHLASNAMRFEQAEVWKDRMDAQIEKALRSYELWLSETADDVTGAPMDENAAREFVGTKIQL